MSVSYSAIDVGSTNTAPGRDGQRHKPSQDSCATGTDEVSIDQMDSARCEIRFH